MAEKQRLDTLLVSQRLVQSREKARALIMSGNVYIDGNKIDKAGTLVYSDARIDIKADSIEYVSRGGGKLEAALEYLNFSVLDLVCMDVGASTGGFTDCLLKRGAKHVYTVDVGYGQLHWRLRQDRRVTVFERTNIRYMKYDRIPEPIDIATIDVSFISLKIVVPAVLPFLKPNAVMLSLIKPQFEIGRGRVGKGGVVKEKEAREAVVEDLTLFFNTTGLNCGPVIPSPIIGPKGNQEYMILLSKKGL
jgi:23S rRNA (cytidine1920-2'-O)/16S rRNA (cytidine1409-2'-O)-methyltransferase